MAHIKYKFWDACPTPHEDEQTVVVRNRAAIYGRYDIDVQPLTWFEEIKEWFFGDDDWKSVEAVNTHVTSIGYSSSADGNAIMKNTAKGWSFSDLALAVRKGNSIYISTHGFGSQALTDVNDYWYEWPFYTGTYPQEWFFGMPPTPNDNSVREQRVIANGQGLPPFNTGQPPVNVAFLMACLCGQDQSWAEGFLYPFGNEYAGVDYSEPENQAFLGYDDYIPMNSLGPSAEAFYSSQVLGKTVFQSSADVMNQLPPIKEWLANLVIWGDFAAKLHGVYTGDHLQTTLAFSFAQ